MKKIFTAMLVLLLSISLVACNSDKDKSDSNGSNDASGKKLDKISIAFVPSRDPDEIITATEPLKDLLKTELKDLGYDVGEVDITVGTNYEAVGEALSAGTTDIGLIPGGTYVLYDDGAEVILTATRAGLSNDSENPADWNKNKPTEKSDKQANSYRALLIAGPSEKGRALAEKVNNGEELTFEDLDNVNWNVMSTSSPAGYIYPALWLDENYEKTITDLSKVVQADSYGSAFARLAQGQIVKDAFIVGTTLAKAASDSAIYEQDYDLVILDEASMAYVPQAAFAAALGKRVIICGDFKQLPPIASSRDSLVAKWLKEDVFHRAGVVEWLSEMKLHPQLFLLKEQRRMHPNISAFTNRYIYHSLVGDHESVYKSRNKIAGLAPFNEHAAMLLDTSFTGLHCVNDKATNSRFNLWQLLLSYQLIHEATLSGVKSIGYVTPYRAQANLMELLLEEIYEEERSQADIIAATVHRFQGSERDVMIFDTVDSAPQDRTGMLLTGKDSERLINVAITRTKGKFLHVSNRNFIEKHIYQGKTLRQLVDHHVRNKQTVTTKEIGSWIQNQHPKVRWMHARKLEAVFQDLSSAKSSIIISLPEGTIVSEEWTKQLINRRKRVKLIVISNQQWNDCDVWVGESFPFPFVILDEKVLWLGLPLEGARGVQPPYVAARLRSSKVCEYLLKQI